MPPSSSLLNQISSIAIIKYLQKTSTRGNKQFQKVLIEVANLVQVKQLKNMNKSVRSKIVIGQNSENNYILGVIYNVS